MNFTILRRDTIDSTNTEATNQARRGAGEGLCVVARQQTAGRGRHGRTWFSPPDAGFYFSLVLRPKIEMRFVPLLTLMTGVAVRDALENLHNLDCDIKWTNDIHVDEKKICGILAESIETNKGLAVVVGIGINLKSGSFPPELAAVATSIEAESEIPANADELLKTLIGFLSDYYDILCAEGGAEKIRRAWAEKSSYACGKRVRVTLANEIISGTTGGIEDNGALRVEADDGAIHVVQAGDVERLRSDE